MATFQLHKYNWESFQIGVDFAARLSEGESLDEGQCSAVARTVDGTDATDVVLVASSMSVNSNTRVLVKLASTDNGTEGEYVIGIRAVTSRGNKLEEEVQLTID